jgi:hypothetical protein
MADSKQQLALIQDYMAIRLGPSPKPEDFQRFFTKEASIQDHDGKVYKGDDRKNFYIESLKRPNPSKDSIKYSTPGPNQVAVAFSVFKFQFVATFTFKGNLAESLVITNKGFSLWA